MHCCVIRNQVLSKSSSSSDQISVLNPATVIIIIILFFKGKLTYATYDKKTVNTTRKKSEP